MKTIKQKRNRLLAAILALLMIISNFGGLTPLTAYAEGSESEQETQVETGDSSSKET